MTQEERNKLYGARCLLDKKITIREGAELLHLKRKGVREQNEVFVVHNNRLISEPRFPSTPEWSLWMSNV